MNHDPGFSTCDSEIEGGAVAWEMPAGDESCAASWVGLTGLTKWSCGDGAGAGAFARTGDLMEKDFSMACGVVMPRLKS